MTDTPLADVQVGDQLILATGSRYHGDGPVIVSRIGRKYLYVEQNGRELHDRFHRNTGAEDSRYGTRQHLYTPAQYDELKQRGSLFEKLREAGIEVSRVRGSLTTDQLRALLAVVTPDA